MIRNYYLSMGILLALNSAFEAYGQDFPQTPGGFENDEAGLSSSGGLSDQDRQTSEKDKAEIGGRVRVQGVYTQTTSQKASNATMVSGSGAELYLDAKSPEGVRSFLKVRVEQSAAADSTSTSKNSSPRLSVDEAKIQATLWQKLFVTAGRQKMKFGTAQFFNPSDFPNQESRDPFSKEDRRPGVDALKLHVPVESINLYAIALPAKNEVVGDAGAYTRAEIAFNGGEFSLSSLAKRNQKTKYGADISLAVNDLDVYAEAGVDAHEHYSSGFTWDLKLNDSDTLTLGAEYHHNGNGLSKSSEYAMALLRQTHVPLQLGREYAAASAYLPKPKWFKHSTFLFSAITNITDESTVLVPQVFYEITPDITASAQVLVPTGNPDGEFRMTKTKTQATVALEALF